MKTEFLKFHSIENTYQKIFIEKAIDFCPEIKTMKFILTEKLHGANMQAAWIPQERGVSISLGRRKAWLGEDEKFNGMPQEFANLGNAGKFNHLCFAKLAKMTNSIVRLYGEFFGGGICSGVEYFPGKHFRFFRISIGGVMMTPYKFYTFMVENGNAEFCTPIRYMADGIVDACAYDTENCLTVLGPHGETNHAEGVVIAPYDQNIELPSGKTFVLKQKHSKFAEKKQGKKKERKPLDDEVSFLRSEFRDYVTDNRLQNVFSKDGKIEDIKEMGKYVQLLLEDAKEDFLKDHGEAVDAVGKDKQRAIYNLGSVPALLIKEYL